MNRVQTADFLPFFQTIALINNTEPKMFRKKRCGGSLDFLIEIVQILSNIPDINNFNDASKQESV